MTKAPRLTIGLPVYNGERYLAESVEALLGQSYEDFELIISDNASTDSTADICTSYVKQDSRVRYIRRPRNIGCAPNHNFLVKEAGSELFKITRAVPYTHTTGVPDIPVDALVAGREGRLL